MKSIYKIE